MYAYLQSIHFGGIGQYLQSRQPARLTFSVRICIPCVCVVCLSDSSILFVSFFLSFFFLSFPVMSSPKLAAS